MSRVDAALTAAHGPATKAVKALDGVAVVAWALLAIALLALAIVPAVGAFSADRHVTPKARAVQSGPAQQPGSQPHAGANR